MPVNAGATDESSMPIPDIQSLMQQALALHQQARLPEAIALYRQILQHNPYEPDALHLSGVLMHQLGQHETGYQLVEAALQITPGRADFLSNLGLVLKALGKMDKAEAAFRQALSKSPDFVEALANLGGLLQERGAVDEAIGLLQQAIRKEPGLANGHMNLGNAYRKDGRIGDAEAAHRHAASLAPLSPETHANLATTLIDQDKLEEADRSLKRAMLLNPALAEAANSFANVLFKYRQYVSSGLWFGRAILLAPGYADAHTGLAELAYFSDNLKQALHHSENALRLAPDNPKIHMRHADRLLTVGRLEEGWLEREWRHKASGRVRRLNLPPIWQGEPLGGKRLLICAEEGVGDEILYASIFPELMQQGTDLVIECDERLVPVFQRSFPDALVHAYARAGDEFRPVQKYDWLPSDKPVDYAIAAGSLALYFRRRLEDFAKTRPYLKPDPERIIQVQNMLAKTGNGLKVALAWRSRAKSAFRDTYYTSLKDWLPIFALPEVQVFSIQYGEDWDTEIESLKRETGHGPVILPDLDLTNDFDDILALTTSVDLLICPSSTLNWIGGALGKETWIFHPHPLYVQYGVEGFPGFPSIKSFAKPFFAESWEPTVSRISAALRARAAT